MLNASNSPRKKRQGVDASYSVLLCYIHPPKLTFGSYPKKDRCDDIIGIIVIRREVIRVTRRENICYFMQHEEFKDHELHCVQRWDRFNIEGSDSHVFKVIKRRMRLISV